MPAWLVNKGAMASEILRRRQPASAVTAAVDGATLRDWLGLGATGRLVVYGGRPLARTRVLRLFLLASLALLLLRIGLELASADMPGIAMTGTYMLLVAMLAGKIGRAHV